MGWPPVPILFPSDPIAKETISMVPWAADLERHSTFVGHIFAAKPVSMSFLVDAKPTTVYKYYIA